MKIAIWANTLFILSIALVVFHYELIATTLWFPSNIGVFLLFLMLSITFYVTRKYMKAVLGFRKVWAWLISFLSIAFSALFLLFLSLQIVLMGLGSSTHLIETKSQDKQYRIDFYAFDAGAMGSFGVRGVLNGPLWFKKAVYYERHATEATIEWISDDSIVINGRKLQLNKGETFGYSLKAKN